MKLLLTDLDLNVRDLEGELTSHAEWATFVPSSGARLMIRDPQISLYSSKDEGIVMVKGFLRDGNDPKLFREVVLTFYPL